MQSVPIVTNVASSNPAHGEVYSMQHYSVTCGRSVVLRFRPPIKLTAMIYNWIIAESGVKHHNPNPKPQNISISIHNFCVNEWNTHARSMSSPYFGEYYIPSI
jgi:hypothetical protein